MGHTIEGVAALLERVDCPIHIHTDECEWVTKSTGVGNDHLVEHVSGDVVTVGTVDIRLLHTPGHTPGSQCFLVDGRLVAGDTLFLEGCGRTDLPGSNPAEMVDSLRRLAQIPDETMLFPGHRYSAASSASMATVKKINFVFDEL